MGNIIDFLHNMQKKTNEELTYKQREIAKDLSFEAMVTKCAIHTILRKRGRDDLCT